MSIEDARPEGAYKVCLHSAPAVFLLLALTGGGSLVHGYFRDVFEDVNFDLEQQYLSQS